MNCTRAQLWAQALVDGELGRWPTRRLERHLRRCEHCARELADAVWVKRTLAAHRREWADAVAQDTPPETFLWAQVRRRLDQSPIGASAPARKVWVWRAGFATAVVAAVVALMTVTVLWQRQRIEQSSRGSTEVGDAEMHLSSARRLTYISEESGMVFIWVYGLPTETEEDEELEL